MPARVSAVASSSAMPRAISLILRTRLDRLHGNRRAVATGGNHRQASRQSTRRTPPAALVSATASRHSGGDIRRKTARNAKSRSAAQRPSPSRPASPAAVRVVRARTDVAKCRARRLAKNDTELALQACCPTRRRQPPARSRSSRVLDIRAHRIERAAKAVRQRRVASRVSAVRQASHELRRYAVRLWIAVKNFAARIAVSQIG